MKKALFFVIFLALANMASADEVAIEKVCGQILTETQAQWCYDTFYGAEDWLAAAQVAKKYNLSADKLTAAAKEGYSTIMLKTHDFSWCDVVDYADLLPNMMPERTLGAFCLSEALRWERNGGRGDWHGWTVLRLKQKYQFSKSELESIEKQSLTAK